MAKTKTNLNPNDDNFGKEEKIKDNQEGGIDEQTYRAITKDYDSMTQKKDKHVSPIREMFKRFKDAAGDPKVFKIVQDIRKMSDLHKQQFWRDLTKYAQWEGVFDQGDIVDLAEGHDLKTGKTKSVAPAAASAAAH